MASDVGRGYGGTTTSTTTGAADQRYERMEQGGTGGTMSSMAAGKGGAFATEPAGATSYAGGGAVAAPIAGQPHIYQDPPLGSSTFEPFHHPVLTFAAPAVLLALALRDVGFQAGLITGVVLMAIELVWGFVNYLRGYRRVWPTLLSPWLLAAFIALLIASYFSHYAVQRWFNLMLLGWLAVLALVSLVVRYPFTRDFAKERTPRDAWRTSWWRSMNDHLTTMWFFILATAAVLTLIPALVPEAQFGPHVLNWIFNYIVPVLLITFGFRYSKWYPTHVITRHNYQVGGAGSGATTGGTTPTYGTHTAGTTAGTTGTSSGTTYAT